MDRGIKTDAFRSSSNLSAASEEIPLVLSSPTALSGFTVSVSQRQHRGRLRPLTSMAVSAGDAESSSSPLGAHARLVTGLCPG